MREQEREREKEKKDSTGRYICRLEKVSYSEKEINLFILSKTRKVTWSVKALPQEIISCRVYREKDSKMEKNKKIQMRIKSTLFFTGKTMAQN